MKKKFTQLFLTILIAGFCLKASAQDVTANAGTYMNAITNAETGMNKAYMAYISAAAHSTRKRKVEKMRNQAVDNIITCQNTITNLPDYKGDNSLRQASLTYIQLCYKVFNDDYAHIVNMEDITERSYDEMQAYLLLQQATNDSLQVGNERIAKVEKRFAAKYNVTLTSEETELSQKMEVTGRVSKYHDKVYLLFYKCNWEDNQLTAAVNEKNVTKIEQFRSALRKYAVEGTAVLDTLHFFENDGSLAESCKQAFAFYKQEAETGMPKVTDYFLKLESFDKLKTAMDSKSADQRTKQDVDSYNKAVGDMNASVNVYNQTNAELNNGRTTINSNFNATEKQFLDNHTPYYK